MINHLVERFGDSDNPSDLCELDSETVRQIIQRGSCRHYEDEAVPMDLLKTLCATALCSPTKSDLQQRDIVIIKNTNLRNSINALFPHDQWIHQAPEFLIFCGNHRRQQQINEWKGIDFANHHLDSFFNASVDAGIALSAFVIAAESMGLGCCPISALRDHCDTVSELINLPNHVFPIAGMTVGWPASIPRVSMRLPISHTVHVDQFSETDIRDTIEQYDRRRADSQPYQRQRLTDKYGTADHYGWSDDKARQYAVPQRSDFGKFIRSKDFNLE